MRGGVDYAENCFAIRDRLLEVADLEGLEVVVEGFKGGRYEYRIKYKGTYKGHLSINKGAYLSGEKVGIKYSRYIPEAVAEGIENVLLPKWGKEMKFISKREKDGLMRYTVANEDSELEMYGVNLRAYMDKFKVSIEGIIKVAGVNVKSS